MMSVLCNRLSKEEALKKLHAEDFARKTVSFYRYVNIENPDSMRNQLYRGWDVLSVLGRVYVASEGINAQISVPEPEWKQFVKLLYNIPEFNNIAFKVGLEEGESFWKLAIKVKKQIVADGLPSGTYDIADVGTHLDARAFNAAMELNDTIVVDMRNHYESRIGHFEQAICPDADTFEEQLPQVKKILADKKNKKILLYCTGGIRCEKASAYLKSAGFSDVNQLHGGIIQYKHDIKKGDLKCKFKGANYVFDGRMSERVSEDVISTCDQCDEKCDFFTNCANAMCNLLFIQCENCCKKMDNCCTKMCRKVSRLPQEEQRRLRKLQKPATFAMYRRRIRPKLKK